MMPDEKMQLLDLLGHHGKWCRQAEARNDKGDPVRYDDDTAVAWDVTGALCRLFGWERACALFGQLDRHVNGRRTALGWPAPDVEMDAMGALQDFNDRPDVTFSIMRKRIETMPTWRGNARRMGAASRNENASPMQT